MTLYLTPLSMTMPSLVLDRRLGQHSDPPQMRATQPPSPSTIMTPLETCQSMPSHFPQSLSTPPHSATRPPSPTYQVQQGAFTVMLMYFLCQHLLMVQHLLMHSMTALHIGCYPMVTAPPLFMPMAHEPSVSSMLNRGPATPYYRSTCMRSLCEYSKLKEGEKRLY